MQSFELSWSSAVPVSIRFLPIGQSSHFVTPVIEEYQNMSSLGTNEEKSNAGDEGAGGTSGEGESGGIRHVIHRKGTMDAAMHVSLNQISENEDNQSGERLAHV